MANRVDGNTVSGPWQIVLTHARRMGVEFHVNDGRRTLAEQRLRIRQKGLWSPSNPTGAAPAVPWAPHINLGRANHAVDADGAAQLVNFLHDKGARSACRPIPAEPWHIQISRRDLLRLARSIEAKRSHGRG